MSKDVLMPSNAPARIRNSDTMDMALLAISPTGGMTNKHTAAISAPQEKEAIANRPWSRVLSCAGAFIFYAAAS